MLVQHRDARRRLYDLRSLATDAAGNPAASAVHTSRQIDNTAPTIAAAVVQKSTDGSTGYIKQGGTYYVYASATDAVGVATITADVSAVTTGQTTAPLTNAGGPWTVGGVSYSYRSALLTAAATLAQGSKAVSFTTADTIGNTRTQPGYSVTVDNTAPSAADIQTANGAATAGKPEQGDSITFSYSDSMDPNSILSGWTGPATNVVVKITDGGVGNDVLTIWNSAYSSQLPLGSVNLGRTDYVSSVQEFGKLSLKSTMVMSGASITVTFGTQTAAVSLTAAATATMTWTPSATAKDRAGNASTTTARTEGGTADKEF